MPWAPVPPFSGRVRSPRLGFLLPLLLASTPAGARPYASQIEWSASAVDFATQTVAVRYFLNEPAETVTVAVLPAEGGPPVASFPGPTAMGSQALLWDGTVDNAGGAAVAPGEYSLEIRVTAAAVSTEWTLARSNTPPGGGGDLETLPPLFPASGVAVDTDPASPWFGLIHVGLSDGDASGTHGVLTLRPDLSVWTPAGTLALDALPWTATGSSLFAPWGLDVALGGEVWAAGQTAGVEGIELARGWPDGTGDADAGLNHASLLSPRDVLVTGTGPERTVRWTQGTLTTGAVVRASLGEAPTVVSPGVQVVTEIHALGSVGFYGKSLAMDDGGNLYLLARVAQAIGNTHVLRFDAAALAAGPLPLAMSQASWDVTVTSAFGTKGTGLAIAHGDRSDPNDDEVYALLPLDEAAIFHIGTSAAPSLVTTLSQADRVIDLSGLWLSDTRSDIACDWAGNIVLVDPFSEVVHVWSPPGPSDVTTPGPPTAVLTVLGETPPPGLAGLVLR